MADAATVDRLEHLAAQMRYHIVTMMGANKVHHFGGSLSATDLVTALYFYKMRYDPKNPAWPERDRFIMSKGHSVPAQYVALAMKGVLSVEELPTLKQLGARLQGHPAMHLTPGLEGCTGSLGQGLSAACGMAIASKMDGAPWRVYALVGDGELQEGQIWEAAMTAVHRKLDNLTAIIDLNGLQIDGTTEAVKSLRNVADRFRVFGWNVIETDGHDIPAIMKAFAAAREAKGVPTCIVAHTIKGKGVSFMENQVGWHGTAPKPDQVEEALRELAAAEEVRN